MKKEDAERFRNILYNSIPAGIDSAALLFSGGTDSLTVLWTLIDLGIDVTCYNFRLRHVNSRDSKVAAIAASHWGIKLVQVISPPQSLAELQEDIKTVVRSIHSARKTHVEVMWGYWHLLRAIQEDHVFSGLQADTLYGTSKSMAIKYGKAPLGIFSQARLKLVSNPDQEGCRQAHMLAALFDKHLHTPYTGDSMRGFMTEFSWKQLNRPKQKMPAVLGFGNMFSQVPIYRRNDNMQCGSGIREYMKRLLSLPENKRYKRVQEVYKSYAR